jgi:hypothetical protein
MYLLLEVVVQHRDIPKHETPIYTPPLRRLMCLIRSSQISDALFGGLLHQIAKLTYFILSGLRLWR